MDMHIDTLRLKQLRKLRFWSQEELAIASGVGLRTVQRLESSGKYSLETLKLIAAAFELDSQSLLEKKGFGKLLQYLVGLYLTTCSIRRICSEYIGVLKRRNIYISLCYHIRRTGGDMRSVCNAINMCKRERISVVLQYRVLAETS